MVELCRLGDVFGCCFAVAHVRLLVAPRLVTLEVHGDWLGHPDCLIIRVEADEFLTLVERPLGQGLVAVGAISRRRALLRKATVIIVALEHHGTVVTGSLVRHHVSRPVEAVLNGGPQTWRPSSIDTRRRLLDGGVTLVGPRDPLCLVSEANELFELLLLRYFLLKL